MKRPTGLALLWLAVAATTAGLGCWQLDRAGQKVAARNLSEQRMALPPIEDGFASLDAGSLRYRRLRMRGRFDPSRQYLVDNVVMASRAGFHVVTPLILEDSGVIALVVRGWVPLDNGRDNLPEVTAPAGITTVDAVAQLPLQGFTLRAEPPVSGEWPGLWQQVNIDRFAAAVEARVLPVIAIQVGAAGHDLVPVPVETGDGWIDRHRGYAFQWFALCATALIFLVLTLRGKVLGQHSRKRTD